MEDAGSQGSAVAGTQDGGSVGTGTADVVDAGANDGQTGAGVTDPNAQPQGDTNPDGTKHEQAVPYERFKEVNDKLSQFNQLIESAKTDPAAKQQLAEMFGVKAEQPTQTPQPSVTPFQEFLQKSVDPQMHAHYDGFARAIAAEQQAYVDEQLAPILAYIGKSRIGEVEKANPDFKQYQGQVAELMKKHTTLDPEEALAIAAYQGRLKAAAMSGQRKEQQRQQSIQKTPVTRTPGAPGSTPGKAPSSIRGMLSQAYDKHAQPA
jgi:hypothetical protein